MIPLLAAGAATVPALASAMGIGGAAAGGAAAGGGIASLMGVGGSALAGEAMASQAPQALTLGQSLMNPMQSAVTPQAISGAEDGIGALNLARRKGSENPFDYMSYVQQGMNAPQAPQLNIMSLMGV